MALGDTDFPDSYIKFFVDSLTGLDVSARLVNLLAVVLLLLSLAASLSLNILSWIRRRREKLL